MAGRVWGAVQGAGGGGARGSQQAGARAGTKKGQAVTGRGHEAAQALSEACLGALERLRGQLDREPGRRPMIASVESLSVRLEPRDGEDGGVGQTILGSLGELYAGRSGVLIHLADPAHAGAVSRALAGAQMTASPGHRPGWVMAGSSPQLGRRLAERCGRLAWAAKEAMREARRTARRRHPDVDWSQGSRPSQELRRVMDLFEGAADGLAVQARARS